MNWIDKAVRPVSVLAVMAIPTAWGLLQCIKGPGAAGIADSVWAWVIWPSIYVVCVSVGYWFGRNT